MQNYYLTFENVIPGKFDTKPPLFFISSLSMLGSWSTDSCLATPFLHKTARESPILATSSSWQLINIAVTAVEPPLPNSPDLSKIVESVIPYALLTASAGSVQKLGYMKKWGETESWTCIRFEKFNFHTISI